jgi:hypothetical protein
LYTLPIEVEGHGEGAAQDNQMDVDIGNNGDESSGEKKEGNDSENSSKSLKEKEQNREGSSQPKNPEW